MLNYIYKYNFDNLYNSKIKNGVLKCSVVRCDMARELISKRDSLLFDQIMKLKSPSINLEEILVILDFSEFIKKHSMMILETINEIELVVHKLKCEDENMVEVYENIVIRVVDFLKSNSMSKDCQVYYINSQAKDRNGNNLYESLMPRVFFDFDKQRTVLSKLYAYSGSLCSDCTLLDDIKFTEDEIVVVKNHQFIVKSDCITMISINFLYDKLKKIKEYIEDYKKLTLSEILEYNVCLEFNSINNSISMDENSNIDLEDIKSFLNEYYSISTDTKEMFFDGLSSMIMKYDYIESNNDEVKWKRIIAKDYPFDLNLFDGEGLISKEFCDELTTSLCKKLGNNKYENSSSFQIRLPYIKGMVHSCDLKQFFKEKGVTTVARTILCDDKQYDINKVKMILTRSQFKADSFIESSKIINTIQDYVRLINEYDYPFGVINANKDDSKNVCTLEYQFISTLPLSILDIQKLYKFNKWHINEACSKEKIIEQLYNDESKTSLQERRFYELMPKFYFNTKKYKTRKKGIFTKMMHDALFSKISVHGYRKYLSGDLLELLYNVAFEDYANFPKAEELCINNYYLPCAKENELNNAVFLRSPHYSRNEIVMLGSEYNQNSSEREKYFSHLKGVVMVNPKSLAPDRLGGADYDGDTVLIVNDYTLVDCVKNKLFEVADGKLTYKYKPCKIPSLKGRKMSYSDYNQRLLCFQNTFSSRVGLLSNSGFIDATHVYAEEHSELNDHNKIAEYTILNGIEIDSVKAGKKPKLDKKINGEFEDLAYSVFLQGKKDYENTGSLKTIKLLDNFCEDRITFVSYDGAIDDEIENKDEYLNNVLNIYYNMAEIQYFNKDEIEDFKIKCSEPKNKTKALAIAKIYSNANKLFRLVLNEKAKQSRSTILNRLFEQIDIILKTKNYEFDSLINNVEINNLEAYTKLSEYVRDNKFHFLTDVNERKAYINQLLNINDSKLLEVLASFDDDGFRLLFMILSYKYKDVEKVQLISTENEKEKIEKSISLLEDDEKRLFYEHYNKLEENINIILNDAMLKKTSDVKTNIIEYLKNEAVDISFADIYETINILESNMVYDVYFTQMENVLSKGGTKNAKN